MRRIEKLHTDLVHELFKPWLFTGFLGNTKVRREMSGKIRKIQNKSRAALSKGNEGGEERWVSTIVFRPCYYKARVKDDLVGV